MDHPKRILVVDDHATNRKLLRAILEAEQMTVLEAADGIEALKCLEQQLVDVVISDILMPRMDGYRFCFELRNSERFRSIPFIIYTSTYTSPGDEKLALNMGADCYITKPAPAHKILDAIREVAARRGPAPVPRIENHQELVLMKEYNQQLVSKLEERNVELTRLTSELGATHAQLRQLLANTPAVIYALKLDGKKIRPHIVSGNMKQLLGFTIEESLHQDWWLGQLHPQDRDRAAAGIVETLAVGEGRSEYRLARKDGTYRWVEDSRRTILDAAGQAREIVGVWTDITDRKKLESELALREQRLNGFFTSATAGLAFLDTELRYVQINETLAAMNGIPASQHVGKTVRELLPELASTLEPLFKKVLQSGEPVLNMEVAGETPRRPGIRCHWIISYFPVISDGSIVGVGAVVVETTERKRAEEALVQKNRLLNLAADVGMALTKRDSLTEILRQCVQGMVDHLGAAFARIWTLNQRDNMLELQVSAGLYTHTDGPHARVPVGKFKIGLIAQERKPHLTSNVIGDPQVPDQEWAKKEGLVSFAGFPLVVAGQVVGVMAMFAREPLPEAIFTGLQPVADAVALGILRERTEKALRESEERFRQAQKMESIGQLAGGVAHDFNNLLTVIQGHTQLVIETSTLDADTTEQLQQVLLAAERAAKLTRQLLTFSHKQVVQLKVLNLNDVLENVSRMLERLIGEDIAFHRDLAPHSLPLLADEGMMEQVLMNLAVNARDAMPNGGALTIRTEEIQIDSSYVHEHAGASPGSFVCLTVADTGCGMSPEIMKRIFEPFFTTKGVGKGTGLGLATVYGIVKQHHGWIDVASEVKRGTTFKVFLPVSHETKIEEEAKSADPVLPRGRETILLVEDEPAVRTLAKTVLERLGYRVLEANSGVAALEVWRTQQAQVDLLLTDMVMPEGMTGHDLVTRLQAVRPGLKVIYTSGYSTDIVQRALPSQEGCNFLQKPYQPRALARFVRKCLDA